MFESSVKLWCVVVGCLLRSVAVRLNMCSKLVWDQLFFRILKYVSYPNLFRTHLMVRGTERWHFQHSIFTLNVFLVPPITSRSFVMVVSHTLHVQQCLYKPWNFQDVATPRYRDNRLMKAVQLSALRAGSMLEAESDPGAQHSWNNYSNNTTGIRTHDFPVCSAVPQPNAPPRANEVTQHSELRPSQLFRKDYW
jgi:hypothetical protein